MPDFQFEKVYQNLDEAQKEAVFNFWVTQGALSDRRAAEARFPYLCYIVRNSENEIIATSAAIPQQISQLRKELFVFGTFIAPQYRETELGQSLLVEVRDLLEAEYQADRSSCIGLYMDVLDPEIQKRYPEAIWPKSKMVYIGRSQNGGQQRVYYFREADVN